MKSGLMIVGAVLAAAVTAGVGPPQGGLHAIVAQRGTADAIDAGFRAFWNAGSPKDAAKAADRLVRDGVDVDAAWQRLKQDRTYGRAAAHRQSSRPGEPRGSR